MRSLIGRIAVFALVPVVSAVASLVAIPAVTERYGLDGWAAVAVGLSVGMGLSVLGELGWALDGPVRVARAGERSRVTTFRLALALKTMLLPLTVPLSGLVAALLAPAFPVEAAVTAVAGALLGLSMSWYFIGIGRPALILLTDSTPKLAAAGVAALAIHAGAPLIVYGVSLLVANLLSPVVACTLVTGRPYPRVRLTARRSWAGIRAQMVALRGRAASAVYIALPVALVALVAPGAVATFAAIERLQRMLLALLAAIPSAFLHWATRDVRARERSDRVTIAIVANAALGLLAGGLWIVVAPVAAHIVFAGELALPGEVLVMSAVVVALTCASRAVGGIALVAYRSVGSVSNSAIAGAAVGVTAILVAARALGTFGALVGEALAEAVVLGWQLLALRRVARRRVAQG